MRFASHGNISVTRYKDVILTVMSETTNIELFRELEARMIEVRKPPLGRPYAIIFDVSAWGMATIDFLKAAQQHSAETGATGVQARDMVVIMSDDMYLQVFESIAGPFESASEVKYCSSLKEAVDFLSSRSYEGAEIIPLGDG